MTVTLFFPSLDEPCRQKNNCVSPDRQLSCREKALFPFCVLAMNNN